MTPISLEAILDLHDLSLAELVAELRKCDDIKVLTRFHGRDLYDAREPAIPGIGIILDTETTGKDPTTDRIIELGMVKFLYDRASGGIHRVLGVYNQLNDPGMPIPAEATAVNHITDEMVAGKKIDEDEVNSFVADADFCIAYNAAFDRRICEAALPVFINKAWACPYVQIDWTAEQLPKAKMDVLAAACGFFFEAHRAELDCRACLEILARPLPTSGVTALQRLLSAMATPGSVIYATASPFETKDVLKARGYRWFDGLNGNEKSWGKEVSCPAELEEEVNWLRSNVYRNRPFSLKVDEVNQFVRFSQRRNPAPVLYC